MDATTTQRLRLRFAKRGDLRLVSHHDLMRCLERTIRRAALPMAQSQGFNPRPKVSFPSALALGIEGRREVLELELAEPLDPSEVLRRLAEAAPPGLDFFEAGPTGARRAAHVVAVDYCVDLPPDRRVAAATAVAELLSRSECPYTRRKPGRDVPIDLRPFVLDASVQPEGALHLRLKVEPGGSARPEEVLEVLGLRDLLNLGAVLARTDVALAAD